MLRAGVWIIAFLLGMGHAFAATPVSSKAAQIISTVDTLDVAHHWPAGQHVHWETGVPDGRPELSAGQHTHCSAFVGAAAKLLDVYILRPPEHSQVLLANAQYDWLESQGAQHGWRAVRDEVEAQDLANRGLLVVAAYRNHHDDKPGHIAIVRPGAKSLAALRSEGPDVTQAGSANYRSVPLSKGFAGHPAAWRDHEVRFFAHEVALVASR